MRKNTTKQNNNDTITENSEKYLTFLVDGQVFAMKITDVLEIQRIQIPTFTPGLPKHIKGIFNIRGKIVPLMELRLRLNREEAEYDDKTSIIVIKHENITMGYIVDDVLDVVDYYDHQIIDSPSNSKNSDYIKSIANSDAGIALILDSAKVLTDD